MRREQRKTGIALTSYRYVISRLSVDYQTGYFRLYLHGLYSSSTCRNDTTKTNRISQRLLFLNWRTFMHLWENLKIENYTDTMWKKYSNRNMLLTIFGNTKQIFYFFIYLSVHFLNYIPEITILHKIPQFNFSVNIPRSLSRVFKFRVWRIFDRQIVTERSFV